MKKIFVLLLALTSSLITFAQKDVTLTIKHMMNASTFAFNQATSNNLTEQFNFSRVEYYISNIKIIHDGGMVTPVTGKYLLVDCNGNFSESLGSFNVTSVEGITFSIGVESSLNHADPSQQPAGSPLYFQSPSMHWGWSSGYRFVAVEGKGGTLLDKTFQLHGLFDQNYFSQTVTVAGVTKDNTIFINLDADYAEALRDVSVSSGGIHHGDNTRDLDVLKNFRDHVFSPGSGLPEGIADLDLSDQLKVYPVPNDGTFHIDLASSELSSKASEIQILDVLGRVVNTKPVQGENKFTMSLDMHGMFFVQVISENQVIAATKLIIQ